MKAQVKDLRHFMAYFAQEKGLPEIDGNYEMSN